MGLATHYTLQCNNASLMKINLIFLVINYELLKRICRLMSQPFVNFRFIRAQANNEVVRGGLSSEKPKLKRQDLDAW